MSVFREKDIIKCKVIEIMPYGIKIMTRDGDQGLIHISEITSGYVSDINRFVRVDDVIYARVIKIDSPIMFSIKNLNYKSRKGDTFNVSNEFNCLANKLDEWIKIKLEEMERVNNR